MPKLNFADLKGNVRTVNVSYQGDSFAITYRPSEFSPVKGKAHQKRVNDPEDEADNLAVELLAAGLVSWEVVDEGGEMLPLTRENLEQFPGGLLLAMLGAVNEDSTPNPKSAGKSFAR